VSGGIFDVDDIKRSGVSVPRLDGSDSPKISSSGDHAEISRVEFDPVLDLSGSEFDFDGITDFAVWVGVPDGSAVVGAEEGNSVFADGDEFYAAEFITGLFLVDLVNNKSSFSIINEPKVFVRLVDSDDIHEPSWVFDIGPDFTVDFNILALDDLLDFIAVQSIVKPVSDKDSQRQAFPDFVGSGIWSVSEYSASFGEHPVVGCREGLEMLFRSTSAHF